MAHASDLDAEIEQLAHDLVATAKRRGLKLATAESCTGGLVSAAITAVPGSSDVFEGGIVAYANAVKTALLGVSEADLQANGAVSAKTALAMADGALQAAGADVAVSVTGIAGPGGGGGDKPVGAVWFAIAGGGGPTVAVLESFGDVGRSEVRRLSVRAALRLLVDRSGP